MPVVTRAQKHAYETKNLRAAAAADAAEDAASDAASDAAEDEDQTTCPVCNDALDEDRVMLCSNGHAVDFDCVKQMMRPVSRTSPAHSGFEYCCPLCRDEVQVSLLQIYGIMQDSATAAMNKFRCPHACRAWQLDYYRVPGPFYHS